MKLGGLLVGGVSGLVLSTFMIVNMVQRRNRRRRVEARIGRELKQREIDFRLWNMGLSRRIMNSWMLLIIVLLWSLWIIILVVIAAGLPVPVKTETFAVIYEYEGATTCAGNPTRIARVAASDLCEVL